jgi:MFS family permease
MVISLGLCNTLVLNVSSLLPNIAKEKYCFNQTQLGMVFSVFELSVLIFTPIVSIYLEKIGRKNAVVSGLIIQIIATTGFGCLILIPASEPPLCSTHQQFFMLAMIARTIQGMADALIITTCTSVCAIEFPQNTSHFLGYLEMSYGLGLMLGPIIGSLLMQILGSVMLVFFAFGALLAIGLFFVLLTFPSSLNQSGSSVVVDENG